VDGGRRGSRERAGDNPALEIHGTSRGGAHARDWSRTSAAKAPRLAMRSE